MWGKCITNSIPKSTSDNPRNPLSHRAISLSSSMYKLYCSILNNRLSYWAEENAKILDEQNGFRKGSNSIDRLASITNIESRKKVNKFTFCAFIDFKKDYDLIDRVNLCNKLHDIGISGKSSKAVRSIYTSIS